MKLHNKRFQVSGFRCQHSLCQRLRLFETGCLKFLSRLNWPSFWPASRLVWNFNSKGVFSSILVRLPFVGWVEPPPSFVGFRCTQPQPTCSGVITKCETQQQPISKPRPKSFCSWLTWPFFWPAAWLTPETFYFVVSYKRGLRPDTWSRAWRKSPKKFRRRRGIVCIIQTHYSSTTKKEEIAMALKKSQWH